MGMGHCIAGSAERRSIKIIVPKYKVFTPDDEYNRSERGRARYRKYNKSQKGMERNRRIRRKSKEQN